MGKFLHNSMGFISHYYITRVTSMQLICLTAIALIYYYENVFKALYKVYVPSFQTSVNVRAPKHEGRARKGSALNL